MKEWSTSKNVIFELMKIVSWNCNGALRNKYEALIKLEADIYIVQECEDPTKTKDEAYKKWASNHLWIGDTKNKGLGVFCKKEIDLKPLDWSNAYRDHTVKYFLPCLIDGDFQLLGVWTHKNNSPNFGYMGQFWKYLQINKDKLEKILIAGDFNSNKIWDEWDRWWNHSDVVKELEDLRIRSLYHKHFNEPQGVESQPTFYLHRKIERPYHIDYMFASDDFYSLKNLAVGDVKQWLEISDHLPFIAHFQ